MTHEPRDKRHWNGGHVTMYGLGDVRKFLLYETTASIGYDLIAFIKNLAMLHVLFQFRV